MIERKRGPQALLYDCNVCWVSFVNPAYALHVRFLEMRLVPNSHTLYVIGNGFDLHHGFATGFSDFKKYILTQKPELAEKIEEYLCGLEGNWCNLEEALAYFDSDSLINQAGDFLVPYGVEDWSDAYNHSYQYEIDQVLKSISVEMKQRFCEWLQTIKVPNPDATSLRLLALKERSKFLTFNYTPTLEQLYKVPPSQIVHIHGSRSEPCEKVILGHGWASEDRHNYQEVQDPESVDTRVMEGNALIGSYFEDTFKPTEKIIEQHRNFFSSLTSVSEVFVWGHSLSSVDMPYLIEIARHTAANNPVWRVSHYSEGSVAHNQRTVLSLGVSLSNICHHKLDQYFATAKT